jgi:hypothetical protein
MTGNTSHQQNCTSLNSKKIHVWGPSRDALGRKIPKGSAVLGPKAIAEKSVASKERHKARLQGV